MNKQQLDALELMRPKVVDEFQRASAKLYMPNVRDALMEFPALLAIAREHEQTQRDLAAAREEVERAHSEHRLMRSELECCAHTFAAMSGSGPAHAQRIRAKLGGLTITTRDIDMEATQ